LLGIGSELGGNSKDFKDISSFTTPTSMNILGITIKSPNNLRVTYVKPSRSIKVERYIAKKPIHKRDVEIYKAVIPQFFSILVFKWALIKK